MTAALLAHSPAYAIGALLLLAAHLCGRLERWHTRRAAAIAGHTRPHSRHVGTAEQDAAAIAAQAIREEWIDATTEDRAA
ncbi:hypothetical protein [Streptomyces sp. 900116325]